jgi:hypothetical protein
MSDIHAAISIIEGIEDASLDQQLQAWQLMVTTGLAWRLQGWYGRCATELIEQGLIEATN